MEGNHKKIESFFNNFDLKFNSTVKLVNKEKEATEEIIINSGNPHLLPTPPSFQKMQREDGSVTWNKDKGNKVHFPFNPKIELPMFQGDHPRND